jgi:hypothetical protein
MASKKVSASKTGASMPAVPTTRKQRVSQATPSTISANSSLDPKPPVKEPVITHDEISLRAYFIAERRHNMGWDGDSTTDWSDAMMQLRAEALEKPLKKR